MRNTFVTLTAALLLIPRTGLAQAPSPPQSQVQAPTPGSTLPFTGVVDFGALFTNTTGDTARFERYRDARDGLFSSLRVNRQTDVFLFAADAQHIGYRDQRYEVSYTRPKLDFGFNFTGQPLNYSYITRTPYTSDGSTLTLDDNAQRAVQGPTFATNDGSAV